MYLSHQKSLLYLCILSGALSSTALFCESNAEDRMMPIYDKTSRRYYCNEADKAYWHKEATWGYGLSYVGNKLIVARSKKFVAWVLRKKQEQESFDVKGLLDPQQTVPPLRSQEPLITWVGHATFLIQSKDFNILTDPFFGNEKMGRIPLRSRAIPAGIRLEDLPPIDAIVISHNHADHTDTDSLMAIAKKYDPIVYVPLGNKRLIESMGFSRVIENTWWEGSEIYKNGASLKIRCLPALHWSIRFSPPTYRKALWSSWMISTNNTNIYFAGDTAYGEHFKQIGNEFPSIDIALLPIGPTNEHDNKKAQCDAHAKYCHVDAVEAVDACIDLHARCFIPMHYGTFTLSKTNTIYPLQRLPEYWEEKKDQLAEANLLIARCGKTYAFDAGVPRDV